MTDTPMDDETLARHLREGFAHFDAQWTREPAAPASRVALMRVTDFLRLCQPVAARIPSAERLAVVDGLLEAGTPFATPLELVLEVDEDQTCVMMHDGRHRARRLADLVTYVPVHVVVDGICGPHPDDVLATLGEIHPEPHDEDDDYPGWDPVELDDRLEPVAASDVFLALRTPAEVAEILGLEPQPPTP